MKPRSLVSIDDLSTEEIIKILRLAADFEKDPIRDILSGKVVATLFFEPSTRTRLSFESAVNKLGGKVIGFTDSSSSSVIRLRVVHDMQVKYRQYR
jgi:aspartate carbamoyltransferase catalytic subunit